MSITDSIQYLRALRSLQKGRNLMYKSAAQPPMDPSMGGGAPPMDPSMGGGMPPGGDPSMGGGMPPGGDPSMGGGMPPGMDPSMMGGMPPGMDPSMMGGMPPMDPSMMMGGMPPMGGMPATPQETEQKVTNKVKTEQWMQHIDSYNYNLLKLMINLYEHLGIPVPAESLLPQPLGQAAPTAGDISGMMGAAADATAPQSPTDAMVSGDVAPPEGGVMGGPPPGGDMGAGGPPPGAGAAPPPMEGGDVKQSAWRGAYNYYTRQYNQQNQQNQRPVNPSWQANYRKQAGISPVTKQASYQQRPVFQYPQGYNDVMTKMNKLRGFN